ncbi:response regulator [Bacillus sp. FJAT-22090]|uniref:response regulator n=1 Tax=Bacillus sp. FJAT-22090 TaxID=1581038 RepID=UPI0011A66433|nr:response regulator [Bacillus sp. FJAT-22090]
MIQTILVDDEILSISLLEYKLQDFPNINIAKVYTHPDQVLSDLATKKIDVAFLDVEMGEMNGLDLAELILSIQPSVHIVFVTAHMEYAVQAFEINSIDYLLKPVTTKRLQKTINRLTEKIETNNNSVPNDSIAPISIKCFNELQVFHNNQLIPFKTLKVKELFGFLLTHMNTYINRDILIDTLWPEHDYQKSKIHLHTCLSHLRKMLKELGYPNCITFANQSYYFTLDPVICDAIEFDKGIKSLTVIDSTNIQQAENISQLYTGAFMELNGYNWALTKTHFYHEQMLNLLDKLIMYFQHRDHKKTLLYLRAYLKLSRYSDKKVKQAMEVLIQQGYRLEAIKLYQEYKQLLIQELEIEPDEKLVQLYNSLLT